MELRRRKWVKETKIKSKKRQENNCAKRKKLSEEGGEHPKMRSRTVTEKKVKEINEIKKERKKRNKNE